MSDYASSGKILSLKSTLQQLLSDNFARKTTEKINLITKATSLLSLKDVQIDLPFDQDWLEVVKAVCAIARTEYEENVKKHLQNVKTIKTLCFELWRAIVNLSLNKTNVEDDFMDIIEVSQMYFAKNQAIYRIIDQRIWSDNLELMKRIFSTFPLADIAFRKLKRIWDTSVEWLKNAMKEENRLECQKLSELCYILIKGFHLTEFHLNVGNLIEQWRQVAFEYSEAKGWSKKDTTRKHILAGVVYLLGQYGFEHRDVLLKGFLFIAGLLENVNMFEHSENTLSGHVATDTTAELTYEKCAWSFIELVATLSVPGCEINSNNYAEFFPLVTKYLQGFMDELVTRISRRATSGARHSRCAISSVKLPLVGRLLVIEHLHRRKEVARRQSTSTSDASVSISTAAMTAPSATMTIQIPRPKRLRVRSSILVDFVINDGSLSFSSLQLFHECLYSWNNCLDEEFIKSAADFLFKSGRNKIKDEERLLLFSKILLLLTCGTPNSLDYDSAWNWAIPLMHSVTLQSTICLLLKEILIIAKDCNLLQLTTPIQLFNILISNISRLAVFSGGALALIEYLLSNFDFDEYLTFRPELDTIIESSRKNNPRPSIFMSPVREDNVALRSTVDGQKSNGLLPSKWRFRQQLMYSIFCFSTSQIDVSDALILLTCYSPGALYSEMNDGKNSPSTYDGSDRSELENYLSRLYCRKAETVSVHKTLPENIFDIPIVDELIRCYVQFATMIFDESSNLEERRIQLWRTTVSVRGKLCRFFGKNAQCDVFLEKLQTNLDLYLLKRVGALLEERKVDEALNALKLDHPWCWTEVVSKQLKEAVERWASDGYLEFFQIVFYWKSEISVPPEHIQHLLNSFKPAVHSSERMEEFLMTIIDDANFKDLLIILRKYAPHLSDSALFRYINALISEANDEDFDANTQRTNLSSSTVNDSVATDDKKTQLRRLAADEIFKCIWHFKRSSTVAYSSHPKWTIISGFLSDNLSPQKLAVYFTCFTRFFVSRQYNVGVEFSTVFSNMCSRFVPKSAEHFVFLRSWLAEALLYESHTTVLWNLLCNFKATLCGEFIDNFNSLIRFHAVGLILLLKQNPKSLHDNEDVVTALFDGCEKGEFEKYLKDATMALPNATEISSAIFLTDKLWLEDLSVSRRQFCLEWNRLLTAVPSNSMELFRRLRVHLDSMYRSAEISSTKITLTVLDAFWALFKIFKWDQAENDMITFTLLQNLFSTMLFALRRIVWLTSCSDEEVRSVCARIILFLDFCQEKLRLCSTKHEHFIQLYSFKFIDVLSDLSCRYSKSWNLLASLKNEATVEGCRISSNLANYISDYCENIESGHHNQLFESLDLEAARQISFCCLNGFDSAQHLLLVRGYWRAVIVNVEERHLTEENLIFFYKTFVFHPHLRAELSILIARFSPAMIDTAKCVLLRRLCVEGALSDFVVTESSRLFYTIDQIDSAELCLVVYDVMSGILDGHSSGTLSELMEKLSENGESIGSAESSEPIAILKKASIFEILNNVRDMYARKLPLILGRFLPIAKYLPIYAFLLLPHVVTELDSHCDERYRRRVYQLLNEVILRLSASSESLRDEDVALLVSVCCVTEVWHDSFADSLDLLTFVRCLVRTKLYGKAYYFLKYFIDVSCSRDSSAPGKSQNPRVLFHIDKSTQVQQKHLVETVTNISAEKRAEVLQLLMQIFIGLNDNFSAMTLPLQVKILNESRVFIAKSNHDWGALGGLYSSMQDFDRMSDAFYHLGSETLEHQCSVEAQYASLIRLASWQDFTGGGTNDSGGRLNAVSISFSSFSNNNGSALKSSFPKIANTHSQRLYQMLQLCGDGKRMNAYKVITSRLRNFYECRHVGTSTEFRLVDRQQIDCLRDFEILKDGKTPLFCSDGASLTLLTSLRLAESAVVRKQICETNNEGDAVNFIKGVTNVVLRRCKELRRLDAYQPALKLLTIVETMINDFSSLLNPSTVNDFASSTDASLRRPQRWNAIFLPLFIERSRLLIANKEPSMASFFLRRVVATKFMPSGGAARQKLTIRNGYGGGVNLDVDFDSATSSGASAELLRPFSSGGGGESETERSDNGDSDDVEKIRMVIKAHSLLATITSDSEQVTEHLNSVYLLAEQYGDEIGTRLHCKSLIRYAIFAESRYHDLRAFTETKTFALKEEAVLQWQNDLKEIKVVTHDDRLQLARRQKEIECEKQDIDKVLNSMQSHLYQASITYLNVLALTAGVNGRWKRGEGAGGDSSYSPLTIVHRFAALLMQNVDDPLLMKKCEEQLDRIPTYVWLQVFNVFSSHLFSKDKPIRKLAETMALNVVRDHPFHTTHCILFHFYAPQIKDIPIDYKDRKRMATELVKRIMQISPTLKSTIVALKQAHDVFYEFSRSEWENFKCDTTENGQVIPNRFKIPESLKIMSGKKLLMNTPIPIISQKINHSAKYDVSEMITWQKTEAVCARADGISQPKVVTVLGSDGKRYKVVFKKDDLRQDALVQQLFNVANLIMSEGTGGHKSLRTYNVLPLSAEYGMIEWCLGTQSLCGWLVGADKQSGAHLRYHPNELNAKEARDMMRNLRSADEFARLCQQISPVFRHFFYEKFRQPEVFHRKVEAYTCSLAKWSIVCYVVGLGDRHLSNILIDEEAGELVHIDLGMIFEYSQRVLKVVEMVPFRLTREMVDPLLVDGVEGQLKTVAVRTLRQIRDNAQVIIGISSLILHDPISTFVAAKSARNLFAETAISRLREKLGGRDLSYAGMTIEQQVSRLFKDASDMENLSRMFSGWMPFL